MSLESDPFSGWTQPVAIAFAAMLEPIAAKFGAHIGLTGGCLYKAGLRKDCDIVVYRHGGRPIPLDRAGFLARLQRLGVYIIDAREHRRVVKATYEGRNVDFLFHDAEQSTNNSGDNDGY